jgi:RecB family endonuclease NucS
MPIFEVTDKEILPVEETTFNFAGLQERRDLQRLLRNHIEVIAPETLLISEEFDEWEDAKRRIDLLAIDKNANLVAIELKRTEDGGFMELQCIRYASMVSTLSRQAFAYMARGIDSKTARAKYLDELWRKETTRPPRKKPQPPRRKDAQQ